MHDIVKELTSTDAFFIATYHAEDHCISYPYYEDPHDDLQEQESLPLRNREMIPVEQISHSLTWKVIRTNEVLRNTPEPIAESSSTKRQHGIGRVADDWLGIPLRQNGKPIGVVAIQSYQAGFRYTDTEIEMMVFMANHIGTALQRRRDSFSLKQAHGDLQASAKELELANQALTQEIQENEKITKRMVTLSHEAGKAEVATGVLHNVGNVLNSINVSANMVSESYSQSRLPSLRKLVDLLTNEEDLPAFFSNDPRGKAVPEFLTGVVKRLEDEQVSAQTEIRKLTEHVNHVKVVVAMQQSFAGVSGLEEPVCLFKMFADAETLLSNSIFRHEIELSLEFEELPILMLERQRVLQVIVNLLKNAKDALTMGRMENRQLIVRAGRQNEWLKIEIEDNGVGIAQDDLTKIFSHGFTTKEEGHGFGLHSCANAIQEMGGNLTVKSDGLGKGATFTITVPFVEATSERPNKEKKVMTTEVRRILVIDDNQAVHEDYRKVLISKRDEKQLDEMESILFGDSQRKKGEPQFSFQIDSAYQGEEGLELVKESLAADSPYAMAFIDMRMPPGWNGIATAKEIRQIDSNMPIVICTAYTDHTWDEIITELPRSELLLILKKPFDNIELKQMATSQSQLRELVELAAQAQR